MMTEEHRQDKEVKKFWDIEKTQSIVKCKMLSFCQSFSIY